MLDSIVVVLSMKLRIFSSMVVCISVWSNTPLIRSVCRLALVAPSCGVKGSSGIVHLVLLIARRTATLASGTQPRLSSFHPSVPALSPQAVSSPDLPATQSSSLVAHRVHRREDGSEMQASPV